MTSVVHIELLLTKYWNEVLHQFKVAKAGSKVEGIITILLMQYGHTDDISTFEHNTKSTRQDSIATCRQHTLSSRLSIIITYKIMAVE